jgi:hypothetical protein
MIPSDPAILDSFAWEDLNFDMQSTPFETPRSIGTSYVASASTIGTNSSTNFDSNLNSSSSSNESPPSPTSAPPSEASGLLGCSRNNQVQMQIILERLQERNDESEAKIDELHEVMRETLQDLKSADKLVQNLLNSGDLSETLFHKLERVYSILRTAKGKLR